MDDKNSTPNTDPANPVDSPIIPPQPTVTDQPTATVTDQPTVSQPVSADVYPETHKAGGKNKLALILVLVLLAIVGVAAALTLTKKETTVVSQTGAVIKKDIPNLRVISNNSGWELFYPAIDYSTSYAETNSQIFEGLVLLGNDNRIKPVLATGWTNPDDATWVFTLKKGVKFHGGREMVAQDVADSFTAAKDSELGAIFADTIDTVEATGPYEVTIKTDGPDPILLNKLAGYYVYDTKSGKTADPINGTGPYTIKPGTTATQDSLELVAFDGYHGGRANVRSVSFMSQNEDDQGLSFQNDKADVVALYADLPTAVTKKYSSYNLEPSGVFTITLNSLRAGSPLQNLKVRQAALLATDPGALAKVRSDDPIVASQVIPSSIPGYDSSLERPARNLIRSKELLAEAGFAKGVSFTLTYFAPAESTAQEIKRQLAEANITVVLDPQTEISVLGQKAGSGGTDAYFSTVSSDVLDGSDVMRAVVEGPNYKNDKVTEYLKQAQATLNAQERLVFLKQASRALSEDVASIPVYTSKNSASVIFKPNYVIPHSINRGGIDTLFFEAYAK